MSKTLATNHIESKMDADSISGTFVSPEVLVVEDVSHYSIVLSWRTVQEERSSCPIDKWTRFAVDQMNSKTDTYKTIYVGFSTQYIVEDLKPCTSYQFRLRICKANGECLITPTVPAFTCREPRYGKDLHQAVNRNDEEGLLKVLQAGTVDVNVCEKLGLTPLMVAAQKGFSRMVHVLVEHGANIHIKNGSGKDALMLACFAGHLDIVMQLRQLGATWQSRDVAGCSPLHWAVDGGHLPVVTYMIQNGCEVDVRDNVSEWTPLMRVSAVTGNFAMAQLLIEAGADINARDKDGKTSLMIAVLNNYEQLVKLLLDSGADRHVTNEFGSSVTEMAKALAKQTIIDLLEEKKVR